MMKKINLILFGLVLLMLGTSCEKDRTFTEFEDLEYGAYARLLDRTGDFFLTDIENAVTDVTVEFYDINEGKDVAAYEWTVQYIDNVNGGEDSVDPVDLFTINSSEFGTSPDGYPSASMSFVATEAMDLLGLTFEDLTGGSTIRYNATVVMNDGRRFSAANTGNNIISSAAFRALFTLNADLLCPSDLAGDINFVTTDAFAGDGAGTPTGECTASGESYTGTITLTETAAAGVYEISDASLGLFPECYGYASADGLEFVDACEIITINGADQFGDTYIWTIVSIDGPSMTIDFINTWGDAATSVLTRADGADWPPLKN